MTYIVIILVVGWIIYAISRCGGAFWERMAAMKKSGKFTYWDAVLFGIGIEGILSIIIYLIFPSAFK